MSKQLGLIEGFDSENGPENPEFYERDPFKSLFAKTDFIYFCSDYGIWASGFGPDLVVMAEGSSGGITGKIKTNQSEIGCWNTGCATIGLFMRQIKNFIAQESFPSFVGTSLMDSKAIEVVELEDGGFKFRQFGILNIGEWKIMGRV